MYISCSCSLSWLYNFPKLFGICFTIVSLIIPIVLLLYPSFKKDKMLYVILFCRHAPKWIVKTTDSLTSITPPLRTLKASVLIVMVASFLASPDFHEYRPNRTELRRKLPSLAAIFIPLQGLRSRLKQASGYRPLLTAQSSYLH